MNKRSLMPHHSRAHIHEPLTLGDRVADMVVAGLGSWRFIIVQSLIVLCWIALNIWLLSRPFDPYPFILLNLAFSTQAAYAAPLLQLSNNRQAAKDRARDDTEAHEVSMLYRINKQQIALLILWPIVAIVAVTALVSRSSRSRQ